MNAAYVSISVPILRKYQQRKTGENESVSGQRALLPDFLDARPPEWGLLLHKVEEWKNEGSQSKIVRN